MRKVSSQQLAHLEASKEISSLIGSAEGSQEGFGVWKVKFGEYTSRLEKIYGCTNGAKSLDKFVEGNLQRKSSQNEANLLEREDIAELGDLEQLRGSLIKELAKLKTKN